MDYYGLYPKFKVNRPLTQQESAGRLLQNVPVDLQGQTMVPDAAVITINSNYLELVDKYYSSKGVGAFLAFFGSAIIFTFLVSIYFVLINRDKITPEDIGATLLFTALGVPFGLFMLKLLRTEWFAWTHYPIRFDRKNREVHVHRTDGSVYSVAWDKVFFTTALSHRKDFNKEYYISAHVLADDNNTVLESFCLPATDPSQAPLLRHWEFVRRYMEEGPQAVTEVVTHCLPIAKKKESYSYGLLYLLANFDGAPLIFFPILFPLALIFTPSRYLAIITSRIPTWPDEVEQKCRVDENDPWIKTSEINSKHPWRDIFIKPKADK